MDKNKLKNANVVYIFVTLLNAIRFQKSNRKLKFSWQWRDDSRLWVRGTSMSKECAWHHKPVTFPSLATLTVTAITFKLQVGSRTWRLDAPLCAALLVFWSLVSIQWNTYLWPGFRTGNILHQNFDLLQVFPTCLDASPCTVNPFFESWNILWSIHTSFRAPFRPIPIVSITLNHLSPSLDIFPKN